MFLLHFVWPVKAQRDAKARDATERPTDRRPTTTMTKTTGRQTDWPTVQSFMEVMAVSWLHFIKLFAPPMIDRGWGRIINVASLAAFAPEPVGSLYPAVKRYMVSMSRAIRLDVFNAVAEFRKLVMLR